MHALRPDIPAPRRACATDCCSSGAARSQEAQRVLKDLLDGAKLGPAHYRRAQAEWLDRARRELS